MYNKNCGIESKLFFKIFVWWSLRLFTLINSLVFNNLLLYIAYQIIFV